MRLPAYPLITVDPFFSIWSKSENLYDSDTQLWCGIKKRLTGEFVVDGTAYGFMGKSGLPVIKQIDLKVTPYITKYIFENNSVRLTVSFWTPLIFDDLYIFSIPCSFIDYKIDVLDNKEHKISVRIYANEEFVYNKKSKLCIKSIENHNNLSYIKFGRKKQRPLSKSGDIISADWGFVYMFGGNYDFSKEKNKAVCISNTFETESSTSLTHIIAYDDIYSIEYFGNKLTGLWKEKFNCIGEAIEYCSENHDYLYSKIQEQENMMIEQAKPFGESYAEILTAASRQVLAAHKLVRSPEGELLYLSKECNSNGCINTVDVSYPAVPMFLLYKPELAKAMMTGIFEFAKMPLWQADYAPHDIGRYPLADGQVYSLWNHKPLNWRKIYKRKTFSIYNPYSQMPVEECGNMLIMSYAYYLLTKDDSQIKDNFDLLFKWANHLLGKGVVLDNQLCTDDFAGHSEKNVNLAIKSIMGIAAFSKISDALGYENDYFVKAKEYAKQLVSLTSRNGYLSFSVGDNNWSLKYNLVWDILFDFNLFDKSIYAAESAKYKKEINEYGVPLDFRKDFTKTDWMLWAAVLDESEENITLFSDCILKYLNDTKDRNCFTDWYDTKTAKECGFNHRSVQAGLWMPVLKRQFVN